MLTRLLWERSKNFLLLWNDVKQFWGTSSQSFLLKTNHIRKKVDEQIVFLDQNEIRRKRQRSSDDASLNVFKKSPIHDGRKLFEIVTFLYKNSYWWLVSMAGNISFIYGGGWRYFHEMPLSSRRFARLWNHSVIPRQLCWNSWLTLLRLWWNFYKTRCDVTVECHSLRRPSHLEIRWLLAWIFIHSRKTIVIKIHFVLHQSD